jgi:hypothetical protein
MSHGPGKSSGDLRRSPPWPGATGRSMDGPEAANMVFPGGGEGVNVSRLIGFPSALELRGASVL